MCAQHPAVGERARANSAGQPRYPAVNKRAFTAVTYAAHMCVCIRGVERDASTNVYVEVPCEERTMPMATEEPLHTSPSVPAEEVLSHECTFQKNQIKGETLKNNTRREIVAKILLYLISNDYFRRV